MKLRTKGEQKAYLDGFEMCADCIEKYLTNEGKQKLECLLMAVRNALEIEDIEPQESEDKDADKKCTYKETGCGSCKRQLDCPIEADKAERMDT